MFNYFLNSYTLTEDLCFSIILNVSEGDSNSQHCFNNGIFKVPEVPKKPVPEEKKPVPVPKKEPAAPPKGTPELITGQPFAPNASLLFYVVFNRMLCYLSILCLVDAPRVFHLFTTFQGCTLGMHYL